MRSLSIFKDFEDLADFWRVSPTTGERNLQTSSFLPAVDVEEVEKHYIFSLDLPGIEEKDLKVELVDDVLKISGERRFESKTQVRGALRSERGFGSFERAFSLPREVDAEHIDAKYKNGVLTITVPKAEVAKARQIPVTNH